MADIDRISRTTPYLCKVSPSTTRFYMEDVHRAGGVYGILGELGRGWGSSTTAVAQGTPPTWAQRSTAGTSGAATTTRAATCTAPPPAGWPTTRAFSQDRRYDASLDLDRAEGCIRDGAHAYAADGGLAVLYGNLAPKGCIVKTAGVDPQCLRFEGRAIVFESENAAAEGISSGRVAAGHVVIVRYEGPRGGPGMQEMLKPTTLLKARGLGALCALVTDGRFSGASSGALGRPCLAGGRPWRQLYGPGRGRRRDRDPHPRTHHPLDGRRRGARGSEGGDGGAEASRPGGR